MGWFSKKKEPTIIRVEGPRKFALDIVGESHHQPELNKLVGGKTDKGHKLEKEALLILEDENPYDNMAVAVSIDSEFVGHLDKKTARLYRRQIEASGYPEACAVVGARIVGGWLRDGDEGHYGIKLDLPVGFAS